MPYNIDSGAILEVSMIGGLASQRVMVVRHYVVSMDFTSNHDGVAQIVLFDAEIGAAGGLQEMMAGAMSSDVAIERFRYQWIYPTRYAYIELTPSIVNGTLGTPSAPPGTSGAITLQADTTGRHSRGTTHVPGVPAADIVLGYITAPTIDAYSDLKDALVANVSTEVTLNTYEPIVYNRVQPQFSAIISHGATQNTARTMSRRVVGRGA